MTLRQSVRRKFANWRVDADGLMRVTACVLAEGCYPYLPEESPDGVQVGPDGMVMQYIPSLEFSARALKSLEGKPVIVGSHEWRTSDNTHRDGLTVGSVAGTPHVEGDGIYVDLLISDAETAEAIRSGALVEVSAAYDGACEACTGDYRGVPYTAIQHDLRFNHVLLLPEGAARCGSATRIINTKAQEGKEQQTMACTVQRQYGNASRAYKFTNEDDAKEAERMAEEQKTFNGAELEAAMSKARETQEKINELMAERDEAMKVIEEQKAQIEALTSAEAQDAMAREAAAQVEAEDAIIDTAVEEDEWDNEAAEGLKDKVCNAKTFAARRRVVVCNMMPKTGADNWTQEQIDGAFTALALRAQNRKAVKQRTANRRPMGGVKAQDTGMPVNALSRIYNSQARRAKGGKE